MELSVVILNYNASPFLELCLHSVIRATRELEAEIIVADNHSTDDSLEMLKTHFSDQIKLMAFSENHGFSKGNNLAVAEAQGTYLCILNPDTLVSEHVFDQCIAFAKGTELNEAKTKASGKIGFIGTQLIDGGGRFLPESKRHIPTPKVARQKLMGNDTHYYYHELAPTARGPVDVLVGAFMFCNKQVYTDCGGFDERYFMYGEDIDLSYTALKNAYQNYYLGDLTTIHFKGESTVKDAIYLKRFYGAMGLFYDKYFKRSVLEKKAVDFTIDILSKLRSAPAEPDIQASGSMVLVTADQQLQVKGIKKLLSMQELEAQPKQDAAILWDIPSLSIASVINFMQEHSDLKYRFLIPGRGFYIASDSAQSKGQKVYV